VVFCEKMPGKRQSGPTTHLWWYRGGKDRFLPHPLQFIIHSSLVHSTLYIVGY